MYQHNQQDYASENAVGVRFNIASYALLTSMVAHAHVCDLKPGDFIHTFGDAHIYQNHIEQVKLQTERDVRVLPKNYESTRM